MDPSKVVDSIRRMEVHTTGLLLFVFGVVICVSPFVMLSDSPTTGELALALFVGGLFIVGGIGAASPRTADAKPPRRTG